MGQNHLSRIAAPKTWTIVRKSTKFIARPMPGTHPLNESLTLSYVLREALGYAKTSKEIRKILNENNLLVDKKIRKEPKFGVGLMDVIEVPKLKESYRVLYNADGRLYLLKIDEKDSNLKLLKVARKNVVKKGKMQITFHDGRNLLMDKFEGHVGDTAVFDLTKTSISKWLKLEKDSLVYLTGGKHSGSLGKVKDIIKAKDLQKPKVVVEIDKVEYTTLSEYAFVVGTNKSEIKLGDMK